MNIRPAPEDQLQRLSMLEGSARLRVAEQRVRDGLDVPYIDVQRPSETSPLRAHGKPRGVARISSGAPTSSFRVRWVRMMLVLVALALLGSALALKLFK
ncbi:hypothetical protein SAMN05216359_1018 [Roseateles sp. YR242]|uniref:hypothetical protein n=1 Tax=Roseateles sp. YR242 TaxID=1855305 RepID=UPI0008D3F1D7|nr:hypothetical protein [Roseateles sp. YR242]SEK20627.1 hypothetical protein SAMN05216359_1018 [Roseateles sp. YR242]